MPSTRRCPTCKTRKPEADFPLYGTRRRAVCVACSSGKAPAPSPAKAAALSLQRPAGFGFSASLEDGRLVIERFGWSGECRHVAAAIRARGES